MSKISLEKFIENTIGARVGVPWQPKGGSLEGQCVSLIQQYIAQCLEQPAKARGNAKDWIKTYVNEGLGSVVTTPQKGDILVFPKEGVIKGVAYGHIAVYVEPNKLYDQNNTRHDNGKAGYGQIFSNEYAILRPNAELVEDIKEEPVEPPKVEEFKVGDKVIPTRLVDYNGTHLKQYDKTYTISEIKGDRVVLMARGQVWAAMNIKDIAIFKF